MDIQYLIAMANQIGDFYESYPDPHQSEREIAEHLNKFWAQVMRQQIAQYVREGGEGLHAQVQNAVKNHLKI